jgi:hypothetical protein
MNRPTAIMIRSICAFLTATWCAIATLILACHAIGDLAIITGCASVFAAFAAGVEYKHAEREYDKNN